MCTFRKINSRTEVDLTITLIELALMTTKNKCWEKRKGGKIWSRKTKKEKKYDGKNVHNSPFWNFHNLELLHSPEASQVSTSIHALVEQFLEGSVDDGVVSHFGFSLLAGEDVFECECWETNCCSPPSPRLSRGGTIKYGPEL